MVLRATAFITAVLIGSAGAPALAQFMPPGPPAQMPPPMRSLPPVSDDELPPYDPPPGYQAPARGPYSEPPQTYQREALPPPGPYGHAAPGYPREPVYSPPPAGYREAAPPNYQPDPRGGPQYGAAPPQQYQEQGLRPPGAIGPGGQQTAAIDPEVVSRLPQDDRPETGPRKELPPQFRRTQVNYNTREPAGTLIVDTQNTYLYLVLGGGKAMRYGIGVGREGFTWAGAERVTRMAEWPDWHPPPEMIERQPYLPRFMAGGEGNPLGARALYLGKTIYRIHGTNQPSTIGTFVSSGCIRLTNEDVIDLYYRVKVGTRVVVLPGKPSTTATVVPTPGPHQPNAGPRAPQPHYAQPQHQGQPESYGGDPIPLTPPAVIPAR
jgi:lipoprotein-anchoring transpeptidase ErfK/SrfK